MLYNMQGHYGRGHCQAEHARPQRQTTEHVFFFLATPAGGASVGAFGKAGPLTHLVLTEQDSKDLKWLKNKGALQGPGPIWWIQIIMVLQEVRQLAVPDEPQWLGYREMQGHFGSSGKNM